MPFCPNCGYEYEHNVSVCPDCDVELVGALPGQPPAEDLPEDFEDWVQIARLTSMQSSDMLVEVLRSKEIPVVVISGAGHFGETGQMGPSSFRPIGGGYSIFVPEDRIEEVDAEASGILGEEWEASKLIDIG